MRCYGVRIGLRSTEPEGLDLLLERLPAGWKTASSTTVDCIYSLIVGGPVPRPGVRRLNIVYGKTEQLARSRDVDDALGAFERDVQLYVAEMTRQRVFVHAGVVAWRGRAIVIPGASFSGKTTLTAELVCAGATYYSDEYAVLDRRGRVHPYPKPLSIRDDPTQAGKLHAVEALGGSAGRKPLPVGLVVVSEYQPRIRTWRPRRLSRGQGVLELLANTVSARRSPDVAMEALERAAAGAAFLKGRRGEAAAIVPALLDRVGEHG